MKFLLVLSCLLSGALHAQTVVTGFAPRVVDFHEDVTIVNKVDGQNSKPLTVAAQMMFNYVLGQVEGHPAAVITAVETSMLHMPSFSAYSKTLHVSGYYQKCVPVKKAQPTDGQLVADQFKKITSQGSAQGVFDAFGEAKNQWVARHQQSIEDQKAVESCREYIGACDMQISWDSFPTASYFKVELNSESCSAMKKLGNKKAAMFIDQVGPTSLSYMFTNN